MFMAFFQVLICIFFVSSLCEILTWQNCFYKSSCTSALSPWRPVIFFIIDHFNHLWTIIIVIHDQARCPQSFSEQCNLLDLIHCQDLLLPGIVYEKVECHFSICKFFYFLTFYNSKSYNVLYLKDRLSHCWKMHEHCKVHLSSLPCLLKGWVGGRGITLQDISSRSHFVWKTNRNSMFCKENWKRLDMAIVDFFSFWGLSVR